MFVTFTKSSLDEKQKRPEVRSCERKHDTENKRQEKSHVDEVTPTVGGKMSLPILMRIKKTELRELTL